MGKLFRYRRPSLNTLLGVTRAKKRLKKQLGITAAMKPFRWWGNQKRRVKRKLGYYSPLGKLIRLGLPRPMIVPAIAPPSRRRSRSSQPPKSGSGILAVVLVAVVLIVIGSLIGSFDRNEDQSPAAAQASVPPDQSVALLPNPQSSETVPLSGLEEPRPSTGSQIPADPPADSQRPLVESPSATRPNSEFQEREWVSQSGKFRLAATLIHVAGGVAHLRTREKTVQVPIGKLSDDDFAYLASVGFPSDEPRTIDGVVEMVADGDGLMVVDKAGRQTRVRLSGIDAPERDQKYGLQARAALSKIVFQQHVAVRWRARDDGGRTLGHVFLGDRWVNKEMAAQGWAWSLADDMYSEPLALAESQARQAKLGIWQDDDPESPSHFRSRARHVVAKPVPTKEAPKEPEPNLEEQRRPSPPVPTYTPSSSGQVHVRGYYRKDGTYVAPHTRRRPSR
jgi:endonuclease YncB( thermonuclease family)